MRTYHEHATNVNENEPSRGVVDEEPPDQSVVAAGKPGIIFQGDQDETFCLGPKRLMSFGHDTYKSLGRGLVDLVVRHSEVLPDTHRPTPTPAVLDLRRERIGP